MYCPATKSRPRNKVMYSQRDGLSTSLLRPPMKAATRRRETSSVTLLAISRAVFKYRIDGSVNVRQSSDDPLRTNSALLNATNIIVIAKITTHIAVEGCAASEC